MVNSVGIVLAYYLLFVTICWVALLGVVVLGVFSCVCLLAYGCGLL